YLTDDATDLTGWQFPSVTLGGGESLVVFASGKYPNEPAGELHTDFKLSGNGEYLALVRPDGVTIESDFDPEFPEQYADVSYGFSSDFAEQGYFTAPSPGEANLVDPIPDPTVQVLISEIMYHPSSENALEEYIELYNRGFEPVNLLNWQINAGVQFTFPDVTLDPGEYLVVVANAARFKIKYGGVTNYVGDWEGQLSNRSEQIRLIDATGRRIDRVTYADQGDWGVRQRGPVHHAHEGWIWTADHDGGGKSLELINPALSNRYGQNWAPSGPYQGTPGAPNWAQSDNLAPMILDVGHYPIIPRSNDQVTVTAKLRDESADGISARVYYRNDGAPSFYSAIMYDDGRHGDGEAGDGLFGAVLPTRSHGTVVEFLVRAQDSTGNVRMWPGPTKPTNQQLANLLYQVDNSFDPNAPWDPENQPVYYLVMTEAERAELATIGTLGYTRPSDAQMNGSFFSADGTGVKVRYNVGIRNRGHGSRGGPPNNYRVNFVHDRPWKNVSAININNRWGYV
ncbi:hypothetical protein LCGC14_2465620, partial [marine sediment metagenome]